MPLGFVWVFGELGIGFGFELLDSGWFDFWVCGVC